MDLQWYRYGFDKSASWTCKNVGDHIKITRTIVHAHRGALLVVKPNISVTPGASISCSSAAGPTSQYTREPTANAYCLLKRQKGQ